MRGLMLFIALCMPLQALADKLQACDHALMACEALVKAQDADIERLRGNVKVLADKLKDADAPTVPAYMYILLGVGAGVLTTRILHVY